MEYNPKKIEKKWQRIWEKSGIYITKDREKNKKNYLLLTEFPYPSGDLHIGHWYAFAVPDILARYLRMNGLNVLYPIGFDAFGLPAENAAIQRNINPALWTKKNVSYMTKQLKSMGAMFDWSRKIETIDPDYYKWTQWFFLKFFENGLAYRGKTKVNWCPKDKTVLANEQVINNCCERCDTPVIQKELVQWMFKTTKYADELIDDLENLDWPQITKLAQKNWIGRSEGALIKFKIKNRDEFIEVFTTRPDTIFGATFLVLAPEHKLVKELTAKKFLPRVLRYLKKAKQKTELERLAGQKEKNGVFTGSYAINPANKKEIPIWISDFVLEHYGTGAIMAVPAHDQRDFEFAKKFKLPIKMVICPNYPFKKSPILKEAFTGEGYLINSAKFSGMKSKEARKKIVEKLKKENFAEFKKTYRLHDWVLSRQRYWGVPIPIIYCKNCGVLPVLEKDLPIKLPKINDYKPAEDGKSPLAKAKKWLKVKCWKCGNFAFRETDTMDTFVDSSWYFIRYTDPKNKKFFADKKKIKNWLPVPMYVGGPEHNTMHLLYSRFFTKALYHLGYLGFSEPFLRRKNHGIILGPDGQKMSKSRGNVVNPDDYVKKFGADTVRIYLSFMAPYDQGGPWDPKAILGVYRFLNRIWNFVIRNKNKKEIKAFDSKKIFHKAIKKIGEDIENFKFNIAVSELMKLLNEIEGKKLEKKYLELFLKLLAPFAPHLSEELWHYLGNKKSIHLEKWPRYEQKLIEEEMIDLVIQVNGKVKDVIKIKKDQNEVRVREFVLSLEKIKKYLAGKEIKKFIYIPNKLMNIVV